jgi:hypothetical protein
MLFKEFHAPMILDGTKTQTRRPVTLFKKGPKKGQEVPPKRVNSIQQCRTRMLDKASTFAHIRIVRVWKERLGDISSADANAEGGYSREDYINGVIEMYKGRVDRDTVFWCYQFIRTKLCPEWEVC